MDVKSQITEVNEDMSALKEEVNTKCINLVNQVQETLEQRINTLKTDLMIYIDVTLAEVAENVGNLFDHFIGISKN